MCKQHYLDPDTWQSLYSQSKPHVFDIPTLDRFALLKNQFGSSFIVLTDSKETPKLMKTDSINWVLRLI